MTELTYVVRVIINMNNLRHISLYLMTFLFVAVAAPVFAGSVHKWVDEQGITHYSDQLPKSINNKISNSVEQVDVLDSYRNTDLVGPQDDYYSVTNQWARMREERIARKQLQLEKNKQKEVASPAVPQVVYINQEQPQSSNVYYPAYSSFGHRGYGNKRYIGSRYSKRNNGLNCRLPRANSRFGARSSRSGYRNGGFGLSLSIR